jgi:C_GCAxxG_C_C family probable redox protein
LSKDDILKEIESKVVTNMENHYSCAMASFKALQDQFGLGDISTTKAAAFLPGIASKGETCGALLAGLMAIGMTCAPDDLGDREERGKVQEETAIVLCDKFEKEYDSLMCRDIHKKCFGRSFDMRDPKGREQFLATGANIGCQAVAGKAVRIAAEIILENRK